MSKKIWCMPLFLHFNAYESIWNVMQSEVQPEKQVIINNVLQSDNSALLIIIRCLMEVFTVLDP